MKSEGKAAIKLNSREILVRPTTAAGLHGVNDFMGRVGLKAGHDVQEAAGRVDAVFGELDYLINGEGVAEDKRYPALQEPEELLKEMLKVNALGAYIVGTLQLACLQPSVPLPHWL